MSSSWGFPWAWGGSTYNSYMIYYIFLNIAMPMSLIHAQTRYSAVSKKESRKKENKVKLKVNDRRKKESQPRPGWQKKQKGQG